MHKVKTYTVVILMTLMMVQQVGYSQPEASFSQHHFCEFTDVHIPLTASGFDDVSSITLNIIYDYQGLTFIDLVNKHPALNNGIFFWQHVVTQDQPMLIVTWVKSAEALTIASDALFELVFHYASGEPFIGFNEHCEISVDIHPANEAKFTDGIVSPLEILAHPISQFIGVNEQANFSVTLNGEAGYQWKKNTGDGWLVISDDETYIGTKSYELVVMNVTESIDKTQYRCLITKGLCSFESEAALLSVSSLGFEDHAKLGFSVYPNPCTDLLNCEIAANITEDIELLLFNINGEKVHSTIVNRMDSQNVININMQDFIPGLYFLYFKSRNSVFEITKVVKKKI